MKYRAEIDGLRALAVMPVLLFHAGFDLFSGGFVGVDVFFVISGYLITTILIQDLEKDQFSIVNFYERRARRILPALFMVMLVCVPFAWLWMLPSQMEDFSHSLIAVSLFASNILFWRESGYFAATAEEKPLLHTWSLSVEEQYYVLFPIFLILTWRFKKNRVFWMIVVMAAISLVLSEWGWRNKGTANFYLAPTRAWELFAGSIAAFIVQKKGIQKNNLLAFMGLTAILFAIFAYDETIPFPSVYTLVPVLGVVLLVLYAEKDTFVAKLLGMKAFVGIGLISYSAYLWHQPLFAFTRIKSIEQPSSYFKLLLIILSLLLAYVSWRFVEKPFRSKAKVKRATIFSFSIMGLIFFAGLGYSGLLTKLSEARYSSVALFQPLFPSRENGYCFLSFENNSIKPSKNIADCVLTSGFDGAHGLIIGDSFAAQYDPFWTLLAKDFGVNLTAVTTNSCFPTFDNNFIIKADDAALKQCRINRRYFREKHNHYDFVIIGAAWGDYRENDILTELQNITTALKGKPLVIISAPKHVARDNIEIYNKFNIIRSSAVKHKDVTSIKDDLMVKANRMLKNYSNENKTVFFISREGLFGKNQGHSLEWMPNGLPYHSDKRHISIQGAKQVFENFKKSGEYSQWSRMLTTLTSPSPN